MIQLADAKIGKHRRAPRWARRWLVLLGVSAFGSATAKGYELTYTGTFVPRSGQVHMQLDVKQSRHRLRSLDLAAPKRRYQRFTGDGSIERAGDRLLWQVPKVGGTLHYRVTVNHRRRGAGYDARMTRDWALLRLDDLVPPASVRATKGAQAQATLWLSGPEGWAVETPYGPMRDGPIAFDQPDRSFDRPVGWALAGKIGIRREVIAGREVAVAAPRGSGYPRLPTLAFLNWTLPDLVASFPQFPSQVLIVSAADNMWRGALSGPNSLYLHADRPLVSENGTSTLLHELVHVGTRMASDQDDWIVEGIAEYFAIEILRRSGGISQARYQIALESLTSWSTKSDGELSHPSKGADTAYAVLLFHKLDRELQAVDKRLDDVVVEMLRRGRKVDRHKLIDAAGKVLGAPSAVLESYSLR